MQRVLLPVLFAACGGAAPAVAPPSSAPPGARTTSAATTEVTQSPWPLDEAPSPCGVPDAALGRVAARIAEQRARGGGAPEPDAVVSMLRSFGEPHVRPRILTASGKRTDGDENVRAKLGTLKTSAQTRCGIAIKETDHGGSLLVAVAIDALADLAPLPTRARTGQWLELDATVHVPLAGARVVVTGPRGKPRSPMTSFDPSERHVRARFTLDRPGAFTVQLVGDTDRGPQPLLEARVFADVEPHDEDDAAPGEDAPPGQDPSATLGAMLSSLREIDGAPPLLRDETLDTLARTHAERMRAAGIVAHDVGDGDLTVRVAAAGYPAIAIAENVVHAARPALAHRALHASPSHRENLLDARYTHVGIGTALADDGSLYACQVFATRVR